MNILKRYVNAIIKESIESLKTKEELDSFVEYIVPKLIDKHMIQGRAVKVCSGISPEFEKEASKNGFNVKTVSIPGHVVNYVYLKDGVYKVDLSAIQFEWCQKNVDDYEDELYNTAKSSNKNIVSPFQFTSSAEKKELNRLLDIVRADPMRAIKIEKM